MNETAREWFESRTYAGSGFEAASLVPLKRGRTVAVVLPAQDEVATIGAIVSRVRAALVHDVPLVDEVLVVDSHSGDGTAQAAAEAGARVVAQQDVLPALGDVPGKGEALWKSLAATTADVLVFVDSDLEDFDPGFVVGLLGPVLREGLGFVKGCFDRPLRAGQTILPAGGGRVTELVARPLLGRCFPDLAGVIQPLAGECAAIRSVLEAVPFACGYGVEIGLLIDVADEFGLEVMGQVDLGVRRHRNSPDPRLALMAAQINDAVLSRCARNMSGRARTSLTRFERVRGRFVPRTSEVDLRERPPMVSIRAVGPVPPGGRRAG